MATIVHPAVGKWGALFPNALEHPSPGSRHVLILLLDQNSIDTWTLVVTSRNRRLTPLREFAMMRFINAVTDKPEWDKKVWQSSAVRSTS